MSVLNVSVPTKSQVVQDLYRILLVFLGTAFTVWTQNGQHFNKASAIAAIAAGGVAVVSVVKSTVTNIV